ncbi:MAG: reverse transcriptase domain-containing protein, partial [Candidatus Pacebacteria bacterium]|nr:reverse transcriptase domain-containing protein [Candidatus Paceibacterota bacterium]
QHGYIITAADVDAAYLQAPLKEKNIYIFAPPGFTGKASGKILRLKKAVYGLKQSGNAWNRTLVSALERIGYHTSDGTDACLFVKTSKTGRPIIYNVYVDDLLSMYHLADKAEANEDKKKLGEIFKMKDLGEAQQFLGMRLSRNPRDDSLLIDQTEYTKELLAKYGFTQCRCEPTPGSSGTLTVRQTNPPPSTSNRPMITPQNYQAVVGSLLWLALITRPDIAQAVNAASRFNSDPTPEAIEKVKRILRYLAGTTGLGILYKRSKSNQIIPSIYCDAD